MSKREPLRSELQPAIASDSRSDSRSAFAILRKSGRLKCPPGVAHTSGPTSRSLPLLATDGFEYIIADPRRISLIVRGNTRRTCENPASRAAGTALRLRLINIPSDEIPYKGQRREANIRGRSLPAIKVHDLQRWN